MSLITIPYDLRYGFRSFVKSPGFAAVAILTLGLGIGVNTAIFSVVNAVLLKPLPYLESERLVAVCESNPHLGFDHYVTSIGAYLDWRGQNSVFSELAAAMVLGPTPISDRNGSELVHAATVSAGFFPLLGIQPILGRQFLPAEENPDNGNVILLSESLWRSRFGGSPDVLNQSIQLGDRNFTVVGVMPSRLKLFDPAGVQGWDTGFSKSDIWRPLPAQSGLRKQRNYRAFLVLGRLKPNVSLAAANREMATISSAQASQYPDSNAGWNVTVVPWQKTVVQNARLPLILLLGAAGFVLLIGTGNLANLSLARAASRDKEFAIRIALGAGRIRLARQLLVESLLLSCMGGVAGLLFTFWSLSLLTSVIPTNLPRIEEISVDLRVLGFAFATSLIAGLLFGLVPSLSLWKNTPGHSLKLEARGSSESVEGHRLRASLLISQVAIVMILLSGAALLTRSFLRLTQVDPGFRPEHLLAVDVSINGRSYTNEVLKMRAVQALLNRSSELSGSESFAAVDGLPLDLGRGNMNIAVSDPDGVLSVPPNKKLIAGLRLVSPGYFDTMRIPLLRGRDFNASDNVDAAPAVIINETFARKYYAGGDPIGKRIASPDFGPKPCEIIGVIKNVKHTSLDATDQAEVFRPLLQECFSSLTIVTRSRYELPQTFEAVKKIVAGVDRNWPIYNARTLDHLVSESLAPRRFALLLMGLFASLALVLAVIGIYGVFSCVVNERTREIGIRLAVGAQKHDVIGLILRQGMRPVVLGGVIGLFGACALTRVLRTLLFEVSPTDPLTLLGVSVLLALVALAACWLPSRRATKIDPIIALRYE
jgi:predicted permease